MALTLALLFSVLLPSPASVVSPSLVVQRQVHQQPVKLLEFVSAAVQRPKDLSSLIMVWTDVHEQSRHDCLCLVPCLPILSVLVNTMSIENLKDKPHHLTEF